MDVCGCKCVEVVGDRSIDKMSVTDCPNNPLNGLSLRKTQQNQRDALLDTLRRLQEEEAEMGKELAGLQAQTAAEAEVRTNTQQPPSSLDHANLPRSSSSLS